MKRNQAYFGLHFDFSPEPSEIIGENINTEVVEKMLDTVRPDYVQVDAKGLNGVATFGTRMENRSEHLKGDPLKAWRRVTKERNIPLYVHYSGLRDIAAMKRHPEWAVKDENGKPSDQTPSAFGPYVDELLIPQLLELALDFGANGVWLDSDCWAAEVDYSDWAIKAYREKTGKLPPKSGEEGFPEYMQFCRDGTFSYLRHIIEKIKEKAPDFDFTSNCLYSIFVPDKPSIPVDYLSYDYRPYDSVNAIRYHSRMFANLGINWELLCWAHNCNYGWDCYDRSNKEDAQLFQEAAMVISRGGGFLVYNRQTPGQSLMQDFLTPQYKRISDFVRQREAVCHFSQPASEIGIIYSELGAKCDRKNLFSDRGPTARSVIGLVHAVQETQNSCEIVKTYQALQGDLSRYRLIVLGKTEALEEELKKALLDYVSGGGSLLLASPDSANLFREETGIGFSDLKKGMIYPEYNDFLAGIETEYGEWNGKGESCGKAYRQIHRENPPLTAAAEIGYGKGRILALGFDLGTAFTENRTSVLKGFTKDKVNRLVPDLLVTVTGSGYAEVSLMRKGKDLLINLVNIAGAHDSATTRSFNEIPPIGPLTIRVKTAGDPAVSLEPEGLALQTTRADGTITFTVPKLEIHSVAVVKNYFA